MLARRVLGSIRNHFNEYCQSRGLGSFDDAQLNMIDALRDHTENVQSRNLEVRLRGTNDTFAKFFTDHGKMASLLDAWKSEQPKPDVHMVKVFLLAGVFKRLETALEGYQPNKGGCQAFLQQATDELTGAVLDLEQVISNCLVQDKPGTFKDVLEEMIVVYQNLKMQLGSRGQDTPEWDHSSIPLAHLLLSPYQEKLMDFLIEVRFKGKHTVPSHYSMPSLFFSAPKERALGADAWNTAALAWEALDKIETFHREYAQQASNERVNTLLERLEALDKSLQLSSTVAAQSLRQALDLDGIRKHLQSLGSGPECRLALG